MGSCPVTPLAHGVTGAPVRGGRLPPLCLASSAPYAHAHAQHAQHMHMPHSTVHCMVGHMAPPAPQARPPMCARAPAALRPAPPRRQHSFAARRARAAAAAAVEALPRRSTKQARLAAGGARRSCGRIRPELRSARPSCGLAASATHAGRATRAAPRRSRRPHAVPARWPTAARLKAVGRRRRWRRRRWRGPRRRRACTTPRYRQPACLRVPARHKRIPS